MIRIRPIAALLGTTALAPFILPAMAQTLPQNGTVASGDVSIGASQGGTLNIDQRSDRAIIDWQNFSVGEGGVVNILQPGAQSALLNRVTGNARSDIAGQINANGQVFLVNPNGIFITDTGAVNAGGFVASTLDITNDDFMAGNIVVSGRGGRVENAGTISIARGGYAALIGGEVSNRGLIAAPLGKVALGAGTRATLDFEGDGFLQIALPEDAPAIITSTGRISAEGGSVILAAADAHAAARGVVNLSGVIEATGVEGQDGSVRLTGAHVDVSGGRIDVSGTNGGGKVDLVSTQTMLLDDSTSIHADATQIGEGGDIFIWSDGYTRARGDLTARGITGGGFIETSGQTIDFADVRVNAGTVSGDAGLWLVDPTDITIDAAHAESILSALELGHFTLLTAGEGTDAGDIFINAPIANNTPNDLILYADRDIEINAALTLGNAGSITLLADRDINANAPITFGGLGELEFLAGRDVNFNADINVYGPGTVRILTNDTGDGGDYIFNNRSSLSFLSPNGSLVINGDTYTLLRSMDDIAARTNWSGHYALVSSLDVSHAAYAFSPIAKTSQEIFSGTFTGLGHTISNLNVLSDTHGGLFGYVTNGTIRDIGLIGGFISGSEYVGALVANANNATIRNVYASSRVMGTNWSTGGLIGRISGGSLNNAYSTGSADGATTVGGLIGSASDVVITNVYSTSSAIATSQIAGGLFGLIADSTLENAYSTGLVIAPLYRGAVAGNAANVISSNVYYNPFTSNVLTSTGIGPLTATSRSTSELQSSMAGLLGDAFAGGANGLYPYLKSFHGQNVRAISGYTRTSTGASLPGAGVSAYAGDLNLSGALTSGADGYFYTLVDGDALYGAGGYSLIANTPNSVGVDSILVFNRYVSGQVLSDNILTSGAAKVETDSSRSSQINTSAFLPSAPNTSLVTFLQNSPVHLNASGPFIIDTDLQYSNDLRVNVANGDLTIEASGSVHSESGDVALITRDAFHNLAGSGAVSTPNGRWVIYSDNPDDNTYGGLDSGNSAIWNVTAGDDVGHDGNRYAFNYQHTLTVAPIDRSKSYGDGPVTISSYSVSGYHNGISGAFLSDTVGEGIEVSGAALFSSGNTTSAVVGTYDISFIGTNFTSIFGHAINLAYGTLTVTPRNLFIQAGNSSRTYGDATSALTYTVGGAGLVNGDTLSGSIATTASLQSDVGAYGIVQGTLSASQNYSISFVPATLTITPREISVRAHDGNSIYGDTPRDVVFGIDGIASFDTNADITGITFSIDETTDAGVHTASILGESTNANYVITQRFDGTWTVGRRTLSIMANDANRMYGNDNPALTYNIGGMGLVNGDTLSGTLTTTANARSNVGNYAITFGSLSASNNYEIVSYTGGTLAITPRAVYVQGATGSSIYGNTPDDLRITAIGLADFDTVDALTGLSSNANIDATTDAGTYALTIDGTLTNSNYTLAGRADGTWTVQRRAVTVAANNQSRIYGNDNPALTYTLGGMGLVNGDELSVSLSTDADTRSDAGSYVIGLDSHTVSDNYDFSFAEGTLTVTPREIYVQAGSGSSVYGDTPDSVDFTVTGLADFDTMDTLTGLRSNAGVDATTDAGTYAVTVDGILTNGNYVIAERSDGTWTVGRRSLTISADDQSRNYGNNNPALTYTVGGMGLVNGDALSGTLETAADARSNVGQYAINLGSLSASSNYDVTFTSSALIITPRSLVVTADSFERNQNAPNPELTWNVTTGELVNGDQLSGALSTEAGLNSDPGEYQIAQGSLTAGGNYAVEYVSGVIRVLAVTPTEPTEPTQPTPPQIITASALLSAANPSLSFAEQLLNFSFGDTPLTGSCLPRAVCEW